MWCMEVKTVKPILCKGELRRVWKTLLNCNVKYTMFSKPIFILETGCVEIFENHGF